MHGRTREERKKGRYMWTAPSRVTASVNANVSSSLSLSSSNSFCKDGRKISVGDCALFKPPQDCRPFIGIICLVTADKENKLKLGVSWFYRPTEVKLGKGILLDAVPNEIFYSFHKDEIPAASLLHPCKVAFLPKGVELPPGICSFVCRRAYDITCECVWWLTDRDYIDDRQQEVDHLLYKTHLEMHATVQDSCSPKPVNSPTASQMKPGIGGTPNATFPSQVKGRKRERMDQGSEPVKRERSSRMDDSNSGSPRTEGSLKYEIAKITEKGGLMDSEGVEKLVQLMLPERNEKKIDLVCRSMLAGVVAATDKFHCLSRFVHLRGLSVFDEWLQEVHKGKIGDNSSPRDNDKSVEEFLIILLRALDKLPVNLNALQTCNIGKSVNHLRSHKNLEIQKKARSLVDTWKKRVEAEMDAKSGSNQDTSWPGRSRQTEASHGGRHSDGIKTSVTQVHSSKSASVKLYGENSMKCVATSPSSTRSAPSPGSGSTGLKDGRHRNTALCVVYDVPATVSKDEKSSGSSQSHNNSQSCSSDHAKTGGFSRKADARSSTAGSMTVNKNSGGSSRHRKSINRLQGSASSVNQREAGSSRSSSSQRNSASEKLSQSTLTLEKKIEVPAPEGSSNKLILKLSNRGRSPAQSVSGGSFEDPAVVNSRASSPVLSEKHDQSDHNLREQSDTYRANFSSDVNAESWQSNDFKDVLTGSDEGGGFPSAPVEECCRTVDDSRKTAQVSKPTSLLPRNEQKSGKLHGGSFSSMDALIESCVRYSEANACLAGADDVGMNLLASVAADEISKSDMALPSVSPPSNTPIVEKSCLGNDAKVYSSSTDNLLCEKNKTINCANGEHDKSHVNCTSGLQSTEKDNRTDSKHVEDHDESSNSEINDLQRLVDQCLESDENQKEVKVSALAAVPTTSNKEKTLDDKDSEECKHGNTGDITDEGHVSDTNQKAGRSLLTEGKAADTSLKVESLSVEHSFSETEGDNKKEQKAPAVPISCGFVTGTGGELPISSGSGEAIVSGDVERLKSEKADEMAVSQFSLTDKQKIEQGSASTAITMQVAAGLCPSVTSHKVEHVEDNLETNEVNNHCSGVPTPRVLSKVTGENGRPKLSRSSGPEEDEAEECTSVASDVFSGSASEGSDLDTKVEFDLNEGFNGDDGRNGDSNNFTGHGSSRPVQSVSLLPFPVPSISSGLPASITVAAAAKGPFVPPDDLLRNKGTIGWKGSAATSAFRPAEPRKVTEVQLGMNNTSTSDACTSMCKQTRPPLDIDLNIPDERILEEQASQRATKVSDSAPVHSSGGLDLDLNRVDEPTDMIATFQPVKSFGGRRDFDLNDGPAANDMYSEPSIIFSQHSRSSLPSPPTVSGIRVNGFDLGNFSSWFPAADAYSAVNIPSILSDRGDQPFQFITSGGAQRMMGPGPGASLFNPDVYRGPVLSSSPAVPFQSTPFQYPVFPFGSSFPLPSTTFPGGSTTYVDSSSGGRLCFPRINSQLLAPAVAVPSNYPRPYVVSLPNGSASGGSDSTGKWFRPGLDLNSDPGGPEPEGRDETSSSFASRQVSASGSLALKEDQSRMYQMSGGVLKRKEPEGRWDGYKQSSWQ